MSSPAERSRLNRLLIETYQGLLHVYSDVILQLDKDEPFSEIPSHSCKSDVIWNKCMRGLKDICDAAGIDYRQKELHAQLVKTIDSVKQKSRSASERQEEANQMAAISDQIAESWPSLLEKIDIGLMRTHGEVFKAGFLQSRVQSKVSDEQGNRIVSSSIVVWEQLQKSGQLEFCLRHEHELWKAAVDQGLPEIDQLIDPNDDFSARAKRNVKRTQTGAPEKQKRAVLPVTSRKKNWFLLCKGGLTIAINCIWGSLCLMTPQQQGAEIVGSAISVLSGITDMWDGMKGKT